MLIGKTITVYEFIQYVNQKIIDHKMQSNHLRNELNQTNQKLNLLNGQSQGMTPEKMNLLNQIRKYKSEIDQIEHETEFLIERKDAAEQSNPEQILHLGLRELEQFGVGAS